MCKKEIGHNLEIDYRYLVSIEMNSKFFVRFPKTLVDKIENIFWLASLGFSLFDYIKIILQNCVHGGIRLDIEVVQRSYVKGKQM